jgi:glycosidase
MTFHHNGQWQGKKYKLIVQMRRGESEPINNDVVKFYEKLTGILKNDAFRKGEFTFIDTANQNLLAWRYQYQNEKRLVVINFNQQQESVNVVIPNLSGMLNFY